MNTNVIKLLFAKPLISPIPIVKAPVGANQCSGSNCTIVEGNTSYSGHLVPDASRASGYRCEPCGAGSANYSGGGHSCKSCEAAAAKYSNFLGICFTRACVEEKCIDSSTDDPSYEKCVADGMAQLDKLGSSGVNAVTNLFNTLFHSGNNNPNPAPSPGTTPVADKTVLGLDPMLGYSVIAIGSALAIWGGVVGVKALMKSKPAVAAA